MLEKEDFVPEQSTPVPNQFVRPQRVAFYIQNSNVLQIIWFNILIYLYSFRFAKFDNYPRTNFDTFPDSLLAVFQVRNVSLRYQSMHSFLFSIKHVKSFLLFNIFYYGVHFGYNKRNHKSRLI